MPTYEKKELEKVQLLVTEGERLMTELKFEEAIVLFKQAVVLYEKEACLKEHLAALAFVVKAYNELFAFAKTVELCSDQVAFIEAAISEEEKLEVYLLYKAASMASVYLSRFELAKDYLQKMHQLCLDLGGEQDVKMGDCYLYYSFYYSCLDRPNDSLRFSKKALPIYLEKLGEEDKRVASCYDSLAIEEGLKGNVEKRLEYTRHANLIYLKTLGEKNTRVAISYGNLGVSYGLIGDYQQQLLYLQKSVTLFTELLGKKHQRTVHYILLLGAAYENLGDYDTHLKYTQEALDLCLQLEHVAPNYKSHIYIELGICFKNNKEYKKAIKNYEKGFAISTQFLGAEETDSAKFHYLSMAECFSFLGEKDHELTYLNKGLECAIKLSGILNASVAEVYNKIAKWHQQNGDFEQQLYYHQQALKSCCRGFTEENIFANPNLDQYNNAGEVLVALKGKGAAFYQQYLLDKEEIQMRTALSTYQLLLDFIYQIKKSYKTEEAKLFLAEESTELYEQGIQLAIWAKEYALAFDFSEQGKSALLRANIQELNAREIVAIPADWLQKEKDLIIELNYLDKRIAEELEEGEQADKVLIEQLEKEYIEHKLAFDRLIEKFETTYPSYYELKHNHQTASLADLQEELEEEGLLVSYFVGASNYYLFVIGKTTFEGYEFPKPPDFETKIAAFVQAIDHHQKAEFIQLGQVIFHWLFASIADMVIDLFEDFAHKPLLIIPHGVLTYLPFEALLFQDHSIDAAYEELPYLLQQCVIRYHYSATLWFNGVKKKQLKPFLPNSFMGFAPIYTDPVDGNALPLSLEEASGGRSTWVNRARCTTDTAWKALPFSKQEVQQVQALFEEAGHAAQSFLYETANKACFIKEAAKAKFLLVAAHGLVNDQQASLSGLVFYPTEDCILSMKDAYLLNLQAELVVLSSCESGIGELAKGEGMMAVNRGILYSGADNVIFTLFKVYDEPSALLIEKLFAHLLAGQNYATALRNAKLDLIKHQLADPKMWTSYVLIGSAE